MPFVRRFLAPPSAQNRDSRQTPGRSRMGSRVHRVSLGDNWSRQVHPDIDSERRTPSFSVDRLTNILDGGVQNTMLRRKVGKLRREAKGWLWTHMFFFFFSRTAR